MESGRRFMEMGWDRKVHTTHILVLDTAVGVQEVPHNPTNVLQQLTLFGALEEAIALHC